ncbi:MAG: endonuclease/exonuclease/phosphatase family protein [Verrucomicrobiota bacterium]
MALLSLLDYEAHAQAPVVVTTNTTIRVMASNLTSGGNQRYETAGLNILKGLKPDIIAMQEFNVSNSFGINTSTAIRSMIDTTFGTNFVYFRETNSAYSIPNGIISRYSITNSGSWIDSDTGVNDRGFAWVQIDLPGTNDLYVVSVHLKASSGTTNENRRTAEANELTSLIATNFPTNAWIIVAGDMNLFSETEGAIIKFKTFLSDSPVPADQSGDQDTNAGRNERYDRVLLSFSLTNRLTNVVLVSQIFSNGLVFDSRVYNPLSNVPPVLATDSGVSNMQHMAVVKDFKIDYTITNFVTVPPPILVLNSTNIIRWQGLSNVTYSVQASTNLPTFSTVGTAVSATTNLSFTNQIGSVQRFFRVVYP